jgi:hypothetical protein
MKTLLIRGTDEPPEDFRELVRAGSTDVAEVTSDDGGPRTEADRIVIWNHGTVIVDERAWHWPDDRDELTALFQSGG